MRKAEITLKYEVTFDQWDACVAACLRVEWITTLASIGNAINRFSAIADGRVTGRLNRVAHLLRGRQPAATSL